MTTRGSHAEFHFIQISVFLIVSGASLLIHYLKTFRRDQLIKDTPTSHVGSAPQGTVEFQGYAWPVAVVKAPVSGKDCAYFHLKVEEERRSQRSSYWATIYQEESALPFACIDQTGYAVIFPQGGESQVLGKSHLLTDFSSLQLAAFQNYLQSRGNTLNLTSRNFFSAPVRITEKVIGTGCPFYVMGDFKTIVGLRPYPLIGEGAAAAFLHDARLTHQNPIYDLQHFDTQHRGQISNDEWRQGYESLGATALAAHVAQAPVTPAAGIMMHTKEAPLYFADCHEEELLQRLESWSAIKPWAGAILIALGVSLFFYGGTLIRHLHN